MKTDKEILKEFIEACASIGVTVLNNDGT